MRLSVYLFLILPLTLFANLKEYTLSLGDAGSVLYTYDDDTLLHIERLSSSNEVMYRHSYVYDSQGFLIKEKMIGDLGDIVYENPGIVRSPYHLEICEYDAQGNLSRYTQDGLIREYTYNDNELNSESISEENCEYDTSGNLIRKGDTYFAYDEANRLTHILSNDCDITYVYDDQGRRIARASNGEIESYSYFGINEIAVFDENGSIKELRIPGLSSHKDLLRPIAIETQGSIYAPIHDVQNNIVKLIDIITKEENSLSLPEPFGENLSQNAPTRWLFAGKPYDKEANLVYFGHRYYSPDLHQWLSIDPVYQTSNLYQYCFNNPLKYFDPDGQFVIAIPLIWMGGAALAEVLVDAAIVGSAAWLGHKAIKKGNEWADNRDIQRNKKGSLDLTLPKDPFKDPRLKDISHPKAKEKGHYQFKDKETGQILQYDKGKPGESGHEGQDHYHRPNPNSTGDKDKYLDGKGNPVPKGSDASHLYPAN